MGWVVRLTYQVRGVFGSIFACEANGMGSTPIHLTTLCTDGEIGHHLCLRNRSSRFESESVYHFRSFANTYYDMKNNKPLHQIVDELVTTHLSTDAPISSVRIALVEAIKIGERLGYAKGYNDAKASCRQEICDCEIAAMEEG